LVKKNIVVHTARAGPHCPVFHIAYNIILYLYGIIGIIKNIHFTIDITKNMSKIVLLLHIMKNYHIIFYSVLCYSLKVFKLIFRYNIT